MTTRDEQSGLGKATGSVNIAPGVTGANRVTMSAGSGSITSPLDVVLDIRFVSGRYLLHSITRDTESKPDTPGLTGEALRQAKIDTWVAMIVRSWVRDEPNRRGREPWGRTPPPDVVTERNVTDRLLSWVAHLWTIGNAVDGKGTKSVAECLGVPRSRAARWVGFARERGFLDPLPRKE